MGALVQAPCNLFLADEAIFVAAERAFGAARHRLSWLTVTWMTAASHIDAARRAKQLVKEDHRWRRLALALALRRFRCGKTCLRTGPSIFEALRALPLIAALTGDAEEMRATARLVRERAPSWHRGDPRPALLAGVADGPVKALLAELAGMQAR
jgi:hypothetical protein